MLQSLPFIQTSSSAKNTYLLREDNHGRIFLLFHLSWRRGQDSNPRPQDYEAWAQPLMDHLHWWSLQSKTIGDSDTWQSLLYLPWPPWAMRQEIEPILSVSCCPRWPRQVNSDCCCRRHLWHSLRQCKQGEGKTMYTFSAFWTPFPSNFHFACYQQVGRVLFVIR